jgi:hypothetical protein
MGRNGGGLGAGDLTIPTNDDRVEDRQSSGTRVSFAVTGYSEGRPPI